MHKSAIAAFSIVWPVFASAGSATVQCDSSYQYVKAGTYTSSEYSAGSVAENEALTLTRIPCSAISNAKYYQKGFFGAWNSRPATCVQEIGMVKLTPGGTSVVSYSSGKLEITLNSDTRVEGAVSVGYRTGTKVNWDIVKTATDATRVRVSSGKDEVTLKPGSTAEISFSIYPSVTNIVSTLTYSATKPGGRGLTGGFTDTSAITIGPSANGASKVVYQFNASKDATPASSPVITTWTLTCE